MNNLPKGSNFLLQFAKDFGAVTGKIFPSTEPSLSHCGILTEKMV